MIQIEKTEINIAAVKCFLAGGDKDLGTCRDPGSIQRLNNRKRWS